LLATSDETSRTVPPWNTKIRALAGCDCNDDVFDPPVLPGD
jgi:hypothetical protein